ncbi:pantetheine-phosphate adenylyltransferase [Caniella muris]|uniref:pantetheine-phosphate adenylyltransferase n=1 Tax=Caniella muris TaxID=2941502 RepID=UPI00203ED61A|nr:pantetheine-phosphate adenylyltransferase [Caniella muris]
MPDEAGPIDHVVVPGTFDPVTYGHLDVIRRATRIAPEVTVAVAVSRDKRGSARAFTLDERVAMVREAVGELGIGDVRVMAMDGLLVDFCRRIGAGAVVKGLRATTDFEYELAQADLNVRMSPNLESIYVMSSPEYGYVSSSIVREIAALGGDVSLLVPPCVERCLKRRFSGGDVGIL